MLNNKTFKIVLKTLLVILCASLYAFFFKIIVEGRGFLAMGASGVAVIASRLIANASQNEGITSIVYMIFYILINVPLLILGYKKISKNFIYFTLVFVLVYSLVVGFIPESWAIKTGFNQLDDLTSAILIGIISGFCCAGALLAGGCAGGAAILSTYLNVKKGRGIGLYNFIFNAIVIFVGLLVFRDVVSIVYTLVYAFVSSIVLDRYYNRNKKILLEIVTTKKDEVCKYLLENSHHGCTILPAIGAYTNENKEVIHTVISWFQLKIMSKAIRNIDDKCFIINLNVYNVNGDFYIPPIK